MAGPNQYLRSSDIEAKYQAQLAAQANQREKDKKAKAEADKKSAIKTQLVTLRQREASLLARKLATEKDLAPHKAELLNRKNAALSPSSPGGSTVTPTEQTGIDAYNSYYVVPKSAELNSLTAEYKSAVDATKATEKALAPKPAAKKKIDAAVKNKSTKKSKSKTGDTSGNNGSDPIGSASFDPPIYNYNAPMVKTAYLNPGLGALDLSPQQNTSSRSISNPGVYQDARNAWKDTLGAKGVIQMDRNTQFNMANSSSTNSSKIDGNLYGFKFLYNPKEVAMHWGMVDSVYNPEAVAGGQTGTGFTLAVQNNTISFSLLLNRIGDMAWLDSNGIKKEETLNLYGTPNQTYSSDKIYPTFVNDAELRDIYSKGTMYDLEYLFKVINGNKGLHIDSFDMQTSDIGWLQGIQVELHLGASMRYLVRINSLDVNHIIFNDSMVPILSEVNISCSRFLNIKDPSQ